MDNMINTNKKNEKLRFLFIQPPFNRHYVPFFPVYEPLHGVLLGSIVSSIADTKIIDMRFDTEKNLKKIVDEFKPDIVGATTHTAAEVYNVKYLLSIVKSRRPTVCTIIGGQHATLLPEDFFDTSIDLICIGPGEETFVDIINTIKRKGKFEDISGIAVRTGAEYHFTKARIIKSGLYEWPELDYSLVPNKYKKKYGFIFEQNRSNIYTITTSGCPYKCSFCSLWATARGSFRHRSPEEIVYDLVRLPQKYVHLTDDNTFHNKDHAYEIYRLLKKYNVNKKILAYARTDTIVRNSDLIEKWAEVGLGALVVGMEAISNSHLQYLNKATSLETNIKAMEIMEKLNIENWAHFVIMPEFEKEDFDNVWDFVQKYQLPYPIFASYTPVAGTPLFFEEKINNRLSVYDYSFYNLQYQPVKTKIPKMEWYKKYYELYEKSSTIETLLNRKRYSKSFHIRPVLGRALVMGQAYKKAFPHITEQVWMEENLKYDDIEHLLLPSLRKDYKPDKYYNCFDLKEIKQKSEAVV